MDQQSNVPNNEYESDDNSSIGSFPDTWRDVPSVRSSPVELIPPTLNETSISTSISTSASAREIINIADVDKQIKSPPVLDSVGSIVDDRDAMPPPTPPILVNSDAIPMKSAIDTTTATSLFSPPPAVPLENLLTPPRPPSIDIGEDGSSRINTNTNTNTNGSSSKKYKSRTTSGKPMQNVVGVGGTTNLIVIPMYFHTGISTSTDTGTSTSTSSPSVEPSEPECDLACRGVLCKLLLMRDATKILKLKGNQNSLWAVFHYYARKQNSRDGQDKLRREIMKSYIYTKQQAELVQVDQEQAASDSVDGQSQSQSRLPGQDGGSNEMLVGGDASVTGSGSGLQLPESPSLPGSGSRCDMEDDNISQMTGDDDFSNNPAAPCVLASSRAVMSVDDNKRMVATVDQIMQSLPTSTSNATNNSTSNVKGSGSGSGKKGKAISLPSPVYNSALSDKFSIVSPIMIVQLIDDFNMLTAYGKSNSGKNNYSTVNENVNKQRLLRIIGEIVCGDSSSPTTTGTNANVINQNSAPSTPVGRPVDRGIFGVGIGVGDSQSVGDVSAHTTGGISTGRSSLGGPGLGPGAPVNASVNATDKGSPVMSLQVMTTFINFITFQRVLFRVAIEMQYIYSRGDADFMARSLRWWELAKVYATPNINPNPVSYNFDSPPKGRGMPPNANNSNSNLNTSIVSTKPVSYKYSAGIPNPNANSNSTSQSPSPSQYFGSAEDAEPVDANLAIKKFLM